MKKKKIKKSSKNRRESFSFNLHKASTDNIPFLNRNRIFTIYKRAKLNDGIYLYWIEENGKKIEGRFLRQELFALNNQFLR